jgi:hypothetical protein
LRAASRDTERHGDSAALANENDHAVSTRTRIAFDFDIAFSDTRAFQGVRWNVQDRSNYEEFYLRSNLSGMPDANQYTPVIAGVSAWQLLHGDGYSVPSVYTSDWMHIQIVVEDGVGEVYIDADTSAFAFRMKGGWESGGFGVYASQLNVAYYTNFAYNAGGGGAQKEPVQYAENKAGTVQTW